MAIDIENHELVPDHEVLEEEQVDELLATYDITKDQLPMIDVGDPVVKQLEAEEGDVIKIVRDSPTADQTTYYRHVTTV